MTESAALRGKERLEEKKIPLGRAVIIGAAPCENLDYLNRYLRRDDFIICADGGRKNAEKAGLIPQWYVGDGDSGGWGEGLPSVELPCEKDFTDSEAAVHQALRMGYRSLLLCACTGGRQDHHLANLFLLEAIHRLGGEAMLLDGKNEIRYLTPGRYLVKNQPVYHYMGLIPLDRELMGVTLSGVKYPVKDVTFRRWETLGVSNEILPGETAVVEFREGAALLIRSN